MREINTYEVVSRAADAFLGSYGDGVIAQALQSGPKDDVAAVSLLTMFRFCYTELKRRGYSESELLECLAKEPEEV